MAKVIHRVDDKASMNEHCPFSNWIGARICADATNEGKQPYKPSMAEAWYDDHQRLMAAERRERNAVAAGKDRAKQWLKAMRKLSAHELSFKG